MTDLTNEPLVKSTNLTLPHFQMLHLYSLDNNSETSGIGQFPQLVDSYQGSYFCNLTRTFTYIFQRRNLLR